MTGKINIILILGIILISTVACKHSPLVTQEAADIIPTPTDTGAGNPVNPGNGGNTGIPCNPDTIYFQNTILPLFISNCAKSGCHNAASAQKDIILDSYSNIMSSGEITTGNASEGDIMQVITETDPDDIMPPPPNQALSQQQINMIAQWINQGAQNNYCEECDTTNVTYSVKIRSILDAKCVGCHNNTVASDGINLTNYTGVQTVALNGRLFGAVNHSPGFTAMPQGGAKLPDCEIAAIRIWIQDGAPNN